MSNQPVEELRKLLASRGKEARGKVILIDNDDALVSTRFGVRRVAAGTLKVGQFVLLDGDRVRKVVGGSSNLTVYDL